MSEQHNNCCFPENLSENDFFRYQLDGFSEYSKWECLNPAAFFKEEFRGSAAENEVVLAYANAAGKMAQMLSNENNVIPNHLKVIKDNSLCFPFLFLCRHTVELSIKRAIGVLTGEKKSVHDIRKLWKLLIPELDENLSVEEKMMITEMSIFVNAIAVLDPDGSQARYSTSNSGELYHEKPIFISVGNLSMYFEFFVKKLLSLKRQNTDTIK